MLASQYVFISCESRQENSWSPTSVMGRCAVCPEEAPLAPSLALKGASGLAKYDSRGLKFWGEKNLSLTVVALTKKPKNVLAIDVVYSCCMLSMSEGRRLEELVINDLGKVAPSNAVSGECALSAVLDSLILATVQLFCDGQRTTASM
jgi:hypothetical protein